MNFVNGLARILFHEYFYSKFVKKISQSILGKPLFLVKVCKIPLSYVTQKGLYNIKISLRNYIFLVKVF